MFSVTGFATLGLYVQYTNAINRVEELGEPSGTALSYGLDDWGFKSWKGVGSYLFTARSRPALESTQPPIQWVLEALSLGVK
jgi:hypothetical protein